MRSRVTIGQRRELKLQRRANKSLTNEKLGLGLDYS